ncbi:MAG: hypothetical protein RSA49_04280 [Anaerovoracaceae bacterium]|uniref:hypothetical protein n=1 Tax=Chryseobacterium sp. TaxID=1871047 RepID=UPI002FC8D695
MMQEEEFQMIHFYLQKGHSIKDLRKLTTEEKLVMISSMEIEIDMHANAYDELGG